MHLNAIRTIRTLLPSSSSVTREEIEEAVSSILNIPRFKELDKQVLIREIECLYRIRQDDYQIIEKHERRNPWLNEKRSQIDFKNGFFGRYIDYLADEKNFAPDTIDKLDNLTDKILDSLFDPTKNIQIDKKGLVVGQVQSGKTSNYIGLICKAADAGFKLIIVLAGIHNNLRSQTQLRIDEGFLGFDTQYARAFDQSNHDIGVGKLGQSGKLLVAHSLTSSLNSGDFTQGYANSSGFNFNTTDPIIAVIKKNPQILKRIYKWLYSKAQDDTKNGKSIRNKALLLIDDEADNASINISNDPKERSTINRLITQILSLFGKNGYVGYTATPFANIFIPLEEDNLFPRDFIINIPAPSNYIGPEKVFGFKLVQDNEESDTVLPIINRIDDCDTFVKDKKNQSCQLLTELPYSLKYAIRCFIITCAIRRLRGQITAHNSMLIHVSHLVRWQDHITELIENQFKYYRRGIDQNDPKIIEEFRNTFEVDEDGYKSYTTTTDQLLNSKLNSIDSQIQKHNWEEVLFHLNDAASRIEVKTIHGSSGEVLEYYEHKNGYSVIAIGGNKLSRGMTLEGLSISYYLRYSRMYDTLMQMGRWFGYRAGYTDLCRLFTSRELNEWFCHITHASEELREEFDYMSNIEGSSPEQYALKVRTHPGILQITASNKLRYAVNVQISWSGRLAELYELKKDVSVITSNLKNTQKFILELPSNFVRKSNSYLWYDIPAKDVISFLEGIQPPENIRAAHPRNLISFISKQLPNNELTQWRVALISKKKASKPINFQIAGNSCKICPVIRKEDEKLSNDNLHYITKSHILNPLDEAIDLTTQEREKAMELTREQRIKKKKEGEPPYPNGEIIRNIIRDVKKPLLIIYLIDPEESIHKTKKPDGCSPFVGYAISFPKSNHNVFDSYAVNKELLDRFNVEDDFDDLDEDED